MDKIIFETEKDGFHGAYWKNPDYADTDAAIIMMLGDDSADHMAKSGVKWAWKRGLNVMSMSPAKKDYGHHNYPLERIETAIEWLMQNGNKKIAIAGASTTGTVALSAAAHFPDITLTIAMTPSDFIWQGFMQGKRDGCKEWPIDGESLLTYRGEPLSYMPFVYKHPEYWNAVMKESKETGNLLASRKLFGDSEKAHPIKDEEFIEVEKIKGKLILVGARDDSLWDAVKYIERMKKRLEKTPHECDVEALIYEHGTHFVFPESLLKYILPIGSGLMIRLFADGKKYPKECKKARVDIDNKLSEEIKKWRG